MGTAPAERTFVFVDLAGFTALTEAHGDSEALELVERFVAMAHDAVQDRGELVKSIGDAVMLCFPAGEPALEATRALASNCRETPGFPILRAGIHHGAALCRAGDWFGATVNLAARVAGQAHGGQTLATTDIADVARQLSIPTTTLGEIQLRNIGAPVELFDVELIPPIYTSSIDPVCRMLVDHAQSAGRLRHNEQDHWFCSLACAASFAAQPDQYG